MPVSTDGVLLGAWFKSMGKGLALDIGTGTGLLSLMCAQRFPEMDITALDIDKNAIETAGTNFRSSRFYNQISLIHQDILTLETANKYQTIICNPPYFVSGEKSKVQQRATARHTDHLDHNALLKKCLDLIDNDGSANFILPLVEGEAFIAMARKEGWSLTSICRVKPTQSKPVNRLLIELSPKPSTLSESELTIRDKHDYTEQFVALTKAFYLKM